MFSFSLLPKLLLAGGSSFLGTLQLPPEVNLMNHTLAGEQIPAAQVVCRDRWGTPMLPDGKASYSLIAPINKKLIEQSLWIPPVSGSQPVHSSTPNPAPKILTPATPAQPSAASPSAPTSVPVVSPSK